jgi:GntR family transcriptional repressor for pyruvate dehydrogenase complex
MTAIKRKKLGDEVLVEIRRMIRSGELKEGDKLPNQNAFAATLGVSRTSLREALHTLSLAGAIEQRPGLGTVIRARAAALFAEPMTPPWSAEPETIIELFEARRLIEVGAVEMAVRNGTEGQIADLGSLVDGMRKALHEGRIDEYTEKDLAFHQLIAQASHNQFIVHFFGTMRGFIERFMKESFTVFPEILKRSFQFHTEILEAIRNRDRNAAVSRMRRHIEEIRNGLEDYYRVTGAKNKVLELKDDL